MVTLGGSVSQVQQHSRDQDDKAMDEIRPEELGGALLDNGDAQATELGKFSLKYEELQAHRFEDVGRKSSRRTPTTPRRQQSTTSQKTNSQVNLCDFENNSDELNQMTPKRGIYGLLARHIDVPRGLWEARATMVSTMGVRRSWLGLRLLHPYSPLAVAWRLAMLLFDVVFTAFWVPLNVGFCYETYGELSRPCTRSDLAGGIVYVVNLLVGFQMGVVMTSGGAKRAVVLDGPTVAFLYVLHGKFVMDLLACIPFIVLVAAVASPKVHVNNASRLLSLLSLMRLVRMMRLVNTVKVVYKDSLSGHYQVSWIAQRVSVSLMYLFILTYQFAVVVNLCASLMVMLSYYYGKDVTWYDSLKWVDFESASPPLLWYHAIYWVITVLTTTGQGHAPRRLGEQIVSNFCSVYGMVFSGLVVGVVSPALMEATGDARMLYKSRRKVGHVSQWARARHLPDTVTKELQVYLADSEVLHRSSELAQRDFNLEAAFIDGLPQSLRRQVVAHIVSPLVEKVHTLNRADPELRQLLAGVFRPVDVPANHDLCRQGTDADRLWLVEWGSVTALRQHEAAAHPTTGMVCLLGETVLLRGLMDVAGTRPWTLRTASVCRLWELHWDDLEPLLRVYPRLISIMLQYVRERLIHKLDNIADRDTAWCEMVAVLTRYLKQPSMLDHARENLEALVMAREDDSSLPLLLSSWLESGVSRFLQLGGQGGRRGGLVTMSLLLGRQSADSLAAPSVTTPSFLTGAYPLGAPSPAIMSRYSIRPSNPLLNQVSIRLQAHSSSLAAMAAASAAAAAAAAAAGELPLRPSSSGTGGLGGGPRTSSGQLHLNGEAAAAAWPPADGGGGSGTDPSGPLARWGSGNPCNRVPGVPLRLHSGLSRMSRSTPQYEGGVGLAGSSSGDLPSVPSVSTSASQQHLALPPHMQLQQHQQQQPQQHQHHPPLLHYTSTGSFGAGGGGGGRAAPSRLSVASHAHGARGAPMAGLPPMGHEGAPDEATGGDGAAGSAARSRGTRRGSFSQKAYEAAAAAAAAAGEAVLKADAATASKRCGGGEGGEDGGEEGGEDGGQDGAFGRVSVSAIAHTPLAFCIVDAGGVPHPPQPHHQEQQSQASQEKHPAPQQPQQQQQLQQGHEQGQGQGPSEGPSEGQATQEAQQLQPVTQTDMSASGSLRTEAGPGPPDSVAQAARGMTALPYGADPGVDVDGLGAPAATSDCTASLGSLGPSRRPSLALGDVHPDAPDQAARGPAPFPPAAEAATTRSSGGGVRTFCRSASATDVMRGTVVARAGVAAAAAAAAAACLADGSRARTASGAAGAVALPAGLPPLQRCLSLPRGEGTASPAAAAGTPLSYSPAGSPRGSNGSLGSVAVGGVGPGGLSGLKRSSSSSIPQRSKSLVALPLLPEEPAAATGADGGGGSGAAAASRAPPDPPPPARVGAPLGDATAESEVVVAGSEVVAAGVTAAAGRSASAFASAAAADSFTEAGRARRVLPLPLMRQQLNSVRSGSGNLLMSGTGGAGLWSGPGATAFSALSRDDFRTLISSEGAAGGGSSGGGGGGSATALSPSLRTRMRPSMANGQSEMWFGTAPGPAGSAAPATAAAAAAAEPFAESSATVLALLPAASAPPPAGLGAGPSGARCPRAAPCPTCGRCTCPACRARALRTSQAVAQGAAVVTQPPPPLLPLPRMPPPPPSAMARPYPGPSTATRSPAVDLARNGAAAVLTTGPGGGSIPAAGGAASFMGVGPTPGRGTAAPWDRAGAGSGTAPPGAGGRPETWRRRRASVVMDLSAPSNSPF